MDILQTPSNLKCSKHSKNQIIFIQVSQLQDDQNIFFCEQCMLYDKNFQVSNCVQIIQILDHSNNSQIINWPPVDDQTLQDQIYNIQTQDQESNQLIQKINKYFYNLKTEVISKIESCQKEMIRNASLFSQYENEILKKISEFQMADQFKSILLNNKTEINEKEKECREFINKFHQRKHNYTQELKQMFDNLNKKEQQIEIETPNQVKTQILEMIEKINFFKKENNLTNNIINQANTANVNKKNNQLENKIERRKNIDLLPDLNLIKSNYLQEYSQNLQMKKLENNSIQIISHPNNLGSYYSNLILDRSKKYVFRFQFKTTKKEGELFIIGLVRDSTKDTNYSFQDKLSCSFYYDNNNKGHFSFWGIDNCIKGDLRDTKEIDCVELRVFIEDEQLKVVDYPNYNHKYVLSDEYKNNLKTYQNLRLAIYLQNEIEVTLINAEHYEN